MYCGGRCTPADMPGYVQLIGPSDIVQPNQNIVGLASPEPPSHSTIGQSLVSLNGKLLSAVAMNRPAPWVPSAYTICASSSAVAKMFAPVTSKTPDCCDAMVSAHSMHSPIG